MKNLIKYGLNERFINEASKYPKLKLARVIAQYRGLYKIATEQQECLAEISGKLQYSTSELIEYPAVGDFVMASYENSNERAIIHCILTRKSAFKRTAVGITGQCQVVAANIDIVFICMSLNNNYNLSRLERYLSIAWDSGAVPVVILTKSDLCANLEHVLCEVNNICPFTDVVATSIFDNDINAKMQMYIKPGITAAFIGSSGVGKSTLINKLLAKDILTTADIGRSNKGKHTTTGRELYILPQGGVVIDTPGMREIGVETADLSKSFTDIEELSIRCKYNDCSHTTEPGCAVRDALVNGVIDERRLANYFKIKREAEYDGLSSKKIEEKKINRMFKEVGGMKNARKLLKENSKHKKH